MGGRGGGGGVGRCQKVYVGWGGHTDTYIYVPSVNNQYKRNVIGYMVTGPDGAVFM